MADSQTDAGRHQLYNNGSLVLFDARRLESPVLVIAF